MVGGSGAAKRAHHTAFGTGVNGKLQERIPYSGCVGPFGNRSRHEAQKENQQSDARPHQAFAVERPPGIEKRWMTEAQGQKKHAPEKPPLPAVNNIERHHAQRERDRYLAMPVAHDRIKNVAAIELAGGKEVERRGEQAGPGGTADGVQEKIAGRNAGAKKMFQDPLEQGVAKEQGCAGLHSGNDFRVPDADGQRGNCQDEADDRAGEANVKQRAPIANRRTNLDKGAKRADESRRGNEVRIAGLDSMIAAGEPVAELVGQENAEQGKRERDAGEKKARRRDNCAVEAEEVIEGNGLVVGVGGGKLRAGGERRQQRHHKERQGDGQRAPLAIGPPLRRRAGDIGSGEPLGVQNFDADSPGAVTIAHDKLDAPEAETGTECAGQSACSSLPGLKRTALPGGMATSSPVRGLRPMPVLRGLTLKTPKRQSSMRSPRPIALFKASKTVSTACSALVRVIPVLLTTALTISSLITQTSPKRNARSRNGCSC